MPISQPNPRFTGYSGFGQNTPINISVQTSSTMLLDANPDRLYAQINNNGARAIWVQLNIPAQVGRGTKVLPGGMLAFETNQLYLGQINAITDSGTVNTEVTEGV